MTIHWFPKHMFRALQDIAKAMVKTDVVIEVLDARLPRSSRSAEFESIVNDKPCVKVLNKADLADPSVTDQWVSYYSSQPNVTAVPLVAKDTRLVRKLAKHCLSLIPDRGTPAKPTRVMVVGIPNSGKSTLLNTWVGKRIANVGDEPAVTKGRQLIDLKNGLVLSDTPGVLQPSFDDQRIGFRLAASGAIHDKVIDYEHIAKFAAAFLMEAYPNFLLARYKLAEMPHDATCLLEEIGKKRGCLVKGGHVDFQKVGELFLRELRNGTIGLISYERPVDE